MTVTTTDLLLEATGVSKTYGAVVALRSASLAVRPGEVHALMGANGAGKSTLVKILTGAVRPDAGTIAIRGRERPSTRPARPAAAASSPSTRSRPSSPTWTSASNLRLTETAGRAVPPLAQRAGPDRPRSRRAWPGDCPLATLRIIDLARALAIEPDVLMLDEMTAALPANLTERVLEVVGRQRGGDALGHLHLPPDDRDRRRLRPGDRPARRRDGRRRRRHRRAPRSASSSSCSGRSSTQPADAPAARPAAGARRRTRSRASRRAASAPGTKLHDVSFDLYPGEVLGVVALEGQGQDELFDILAGIERPSERRRSSSTAQPVSFRHPADAIRAGVVYVAADRAEALLMQRSVRENIALPLHARLRALGPDRPPAESGRRSTARSRRSRSTRAPAARCAACRAATSRR